MRIIGNWYQLKGCTAPAFNVTHYQSQPFSCYVFVDAEGRQGVWDSYQLEAAIRDGDVQPWSARGEHQ